MFLYLSVNIFSHFFPFVDIFRYQNSGKNAGLRIKNGPGFQCQFFTDYATIGKSLKPSLQPFIYF